MLDTEKKISMDGQEIPILWKYIFNLEARIDKLEQIVVTDIDQEVNQDKAESDSQELTESELAKVLDNLMPQPPIKKKSLLDKPWQDVSRVKDITPVIEVEDLNQKRKDFIQQEICLEQLEENARELLDKRSKTQQEFSNRLKNAKQDLENNTQETVSADIKEEINYYRGYIIPTYNLKKKAVIPPEKIPSDEYFLSKEYQELRQAKLSLQPKCEFSGTTAQHVMHKHYNSLGAETPEDMWSLCTWHYKEVIGKPPEGEAPFNVKWVIVSPNNYVFKVNVMSVFARANELHNSSLTDVARGRRFHHKGWKCYHYEDYQRVLDHLNTTNKKISDGTIAAKSYPSIREINEKEKKPNESQAFSSKLN